MAIRVMLIDDEAGIRMLLGKIIQKQAHFEIVGESANLTDAVTMFNKLKTGCGIFRCGAWRSRRKRD